jgi:O-antigen ligase
VSIFWSVDVDRTYSRLITYAQLAFLVFVIWDIYTTSTAIRAALQIYLFGCYVSIFNLLSNYSSSIGAPSHRFSAAGFNANDIAFILALGIPVAWYLAFCESNEKTDAYWLKWVNYVYIPIAVLAIFLTGSRGAIITALPAFLFIFVSLNRLKLYLRVLGLAILVGSFFVIQPLIPQSSLQRIISTGDAVADGDLNGRMAIWREAVELFMQNPIIGVGSGAFKAAATETGKVAHNFVLALLAELGIIGCGLFFIILAMAFYKALNQPKWLSWLWICVLTGWVLNAATHNHEHKKQTWLFFSLVIVSAVLYERRDEAQVQATRQWPRIIIK